MVKLKYQFGINDWVEYYTYEVEQERVRTALREIITDIYNFPSASKNALMELVFDVEDYLVDVYYDELCEYFYEEAYEEYTTKH